MKKTLLSLVAILLLGGAAMAQTPRGFNYQAVVRGDNGRLLENRTVGVRLTIRQGSAAGNAVYLYTCQLQTNANGLLTIIVGENSDAYDTIHWGNGPYYLVSEIDPNGGSNYSLSTTQQILSVPYAEHARVADHISESFTYDETDPLFHSWGYAWDSITGAPTTIEWDSVTNKPTTIAWDSVTDKPTSVDWSMITGAPTTIVWDSIVGAPSIITTIVWDSIVGIPNSLSQLVADPHLNPILVGDSLYFLATSDTVDLSPLRTTSLPWSNITEKPTTIEWDSVTGKPTTLPWDSVTAKPDTLMLGNDTTLYFGADSMYSVDLKRLVNHTLPWDSVTAK
ncbi:MAG: hypothetical protein ACSW8I_07050, partial [bacterium]